MELVKDSAVYAGWKGKSDAFGRRLRIADRSDEN
jgi:hypothetical protein